MSMCVVTNASMKESRQMNEAGAYVVGSDRVIASFAAVSKLSKDAVDKSVATAGLTMQTETIRNLQGGRPPKTNAYPHTGMAYRITGDYIRQMNLKIGKFADFTTATVGTTAPQAYALEFGFTGVDAIGRTQHRNAFPHLGPAFDKVAPLFAADLEAKVDAMTEGF